MYILFTIYYTICVYNGIIILYVCDCVYKSYYNFCLKLDFISKVYSSTVKKSKTFY